MNKPISRLEWLLIILITIMTVQSIVVGTLLSVAIAGGSATTDLISEMLTTTKDLLTVSQSANQAMEAVASSEAREGINQIMGFLAWVNQIERTHPQLAVSFRNIFDAMEENASPGIGNNIVSLFSSLFSMKDMMTPLNQTLESINSVTNLTYHLEQRFMNTKSFEINF